MKCSFCNTEYQGANRFCPGCGKPVNKAAVYGDSVGAEAVPRNEGRNVLDRIFSTEHLYPDVSPTPQLWKSILKLKRFAVVRVCIVICIMSRLHGYSNLQILSWLAVPAYVILLAVSVNLTARISCLFGRAGFPLYAKMVRGIMIQCVILLPCFVILNILSLSVILPLTASDVLFVILLVFLVLLLIPAVYMNVYCLLRLFNVDKAIRTLSDGGNLNPVPDGKYYLWAGIATVMYLFLWLFVLFLRPSVIAYLFSV